jgi:hypothetical protein
VSAGSILAQDEMITELHMANSAAMDRKWLGLFKRGTASFPWTDWLTDWLSDCLADWVPDSLAD